MRCGNAGCKNNPHADIRWGGTLPTQTMTICEKCLENFMADMRGHIQANLIHFTILPPGSMTTNSVDTSVLDWFDPNKLHELVEECLYEEYDRKVAEIFALIEARKENATQTV